MGRDLEGTDAGTVIVAVVDAIAERLDDLEPAALADEPDAVHQLRTQVRRLRSVLAAYAPLFDASVAEGLRRRYREFGRELGTVRDIEVRIQVAEGALQEMLDESPAVRALLVDSELDGHRLAHARFAERQRMPRAAARRDALAGFLARPPLTPLAAGPADAVLAEVVDREARRTVRRAAHIDASAAVEELHAVRKAGRRLRYAAEAVSDDPVALFGGDARALADAGEDLHDLLGDHRDDVLFAEHVRRAAAHAAHGGEPVAALVGLADAAERRAVERLSGLEGAEHELRRAAKAWASR
jgi:CHAD domain-containing protein